MIVMIDYDIFPGVGHAGAAMAALRSKDLVNTIKSLKQPVLGICVGMQLMAEKSVEGDTSCLGIVPGVVTKFDKTQGYKVPHMGWNQLNGITSWGVQFHPEKSGEVGAQMIRNFLEKEL